MKSNIIYSLLSLYFSKEKICKIQNQPSKKRAVSASSIQQPLHKEKRLISNVKIKASESTSIEGQVEIDKTRVLLKKTSGINILVAEDNKADQVLISSLLRKEKYNFDVVKNGWEAVCAFEEGNYDLVLMDINMPIMTGDEATISIRKLNNQIPIVALTDAICYDLFKDKLNLGFTDVLSKPLNNALFIRTIGSLIDVTTQTKQAKAAFDSLTWAS